MSSESFSGKTVSDAQSENESSGAGRVRDAERMRQYDGVSCPSEDPETEFDLSIDGVPGDEIGQKRAEQGRLDRGTDEAVNGSWGGPGGESEYDDKSLYTQERIEGREEELETISNRAGANPEVYPRAEEKRAREQRSMETHQKRMEECRDEVEAEAASGYVGRGFEDDPREHLDKETVGEIYTQSERVAERFGRSRAMIAKQLSERVANGTEISEAVMNLVEDLCEDRTVVSPLSMVEPTDSWATIEGVVAKLFEPASSNQQQVAIVEDESGEAKLTIWRNSNMDVRLNEGDVIRVVDGKPSAYGNQTTLAATSDTEIWRREKGEGPSPVGGIEIAERTPSTSEIPEEDEFTKAKTDHREQWVFPQAADMPDTENVEVDLGSFEGAEERPNVVRGESKTSDKVVFCALAGRESDTYELSWGGEVREEFAKRGREQRISEEKYNVPRWKKTVSRINHYEHTSISEFGANDQMVHLDLPALSSDE